MNQIQHEVQRLIEMWITAELRGDTSFLEQTLADDFVAVGPLGFMLSKREWIERHQSGNFKYDRLDMDEITVRSYNNDTALVTGRQLQDASYLSNPVAMQQLRSTIVLVRRGGDWQLAGIHMSAISQPPRSAQQPEVRE